MLLFALCFSYLLSVFLHLSSCLLFLFVYLFIHPTFSLLTIPPPPRSLLSAPCFLPPAPPTCFLLINLCPTCFLHLYTCFPIQLPPPLLALILLPALCFLTRVLLPPSLSLLYLGCSSPEEVRRLSLFSIILTCLLVRLLASVRLISYCYLLPAPTHARQHR